MRDIRIWWALARRMAWGWWPDRKTGLRSWWAGADLPERGMTVFVAAFLAFCVGFLGMAMAAASGPSEGVPCPELGSEVAGQHAFEPGGTHFDRVNGVLVTAIYGEGGHRARCAMALNKHRCEVTGPTILRSEIYGARRYFEVPAGESAALIVRSSRARCVMFGA
ncbi:hypothetical protein [Pseudoroseicyclus tamaricis]|uniref:Uncharacterized protein n=1 Tax=Pseudoroseicyclus tamaricis TaxID=2705421 RepID=A0A6B2K138_9RHOB|nr:hypothetical protein [Pseudoroseicyclus tamaricis]NDV02144.1 hypothetical protein [Pseudoroseicyclus tamaricis]